MRIELVCALILSVVVATIAVDKAEPIAADKPKDDSRFFVYSGTGITFTTFTVIKKTTTITSILTSTTTCTTSTSALTTCTIGRRRRGLFYDEAENQGRSRRGLFYNDNEADSKDGSVFLPAAPTSVEDPTKEIITTTVDESSIIPLEIQSGYTLPEGLPANRFLLAFGTHTVTSFTVSTSTSSLTAICSSTSGFFLCGSGK